MRQGALGATLALILAGCGGSSGHGVGATFTLETTDPTEVALTASPCHGLGGYSDFQKGLQFTVRDASNTIIGFGTFDTAQLDTTQRYCMLSGSIASLPDEAIYVLDLGRRGTINFSKADLQAANWIMAATLGNS